MAERAFEHVFRENDEPRTESLPISAALPEILYIMGTGRSGTTILEILLANNPGFSGVGEVKHIFRDGFLRDLPCGCGRATHRCELWSAVLHSTKWTPPHCAHLARELADLESHQRFALTWAGWSAHRIEAYAAANRELFASVARARRCRIVVDSSKFAGRALLLARSFPHNVKVLCITRSAEGILSAFKKQNDEEQRPKGTLAVAAYYLYVLLCMRIVKSELGDRCCAIRFEDLQNDPLGALARIEHWSGYSLSTARARIAARESFNVGHIVTGNRLRKAGRVRFETSARAHEKRQKRPWGLERWLTSALESYRKLMGF